MDFFFSLDLYSALLTPPVDGPDLWMAAAVRVTLPLRLDEIDLRQALTAVCRRCALAIFDQRTLL